MSEFYQNKQERVNIDSTQPEAIERSKRTDKLIKWLKDQLPSYKIESTFQYKENPDFLLVTFSPHIENYQSENGDNIEYDEDDSYEEDYDNEAELNFKLLIKPTNYSEQKKLIPKLMYKGGVARNRLCQTVYGKQLHISDIDLVYLVDQHDEFRPLKRYPRHKQTDIINAVRHKIPAEFKQVDLDITNLSEYFDSRDFTINEVALTSEGLICTPAAYQDIKNKVIRPSDNEKGVWVDSNQIERYRSRIITRALKFLIEFQSQLGEDAEIKEIENWEFDPEEVFPVDLAKALDDGFARGENTGQIMYIELVKRGLIDPQIASNSRDLTTILRLMMRKNKRRPFKFKHAPHRHLDK